MAAWDARRGVGGPARLGVRAAATGAALAGILAGAAGRGSAAPAQGSSVPALERTSAPNIIFIDICSARADHFGAYGYKGGATTGMDSFARDSALFENAMSEASWCLANYAGLFTGLRPEGHGLYAMAPARLQESQATLAERLREAGYATAAFSGGTWLLPQWGLDRGFDHYVNTLSTSGRLTAFSRRMPEMLDWIRARGGRPFFLYASIEDLHLPYAGDLMAASEPGPELVDIGAGASASARLLRPPENPARPKPSGAGQPGQRPGAIPELVAKYDASLARADRQISRLLDAVKEMGLRDATVVIITGDHGEHLGEHGLTGHMEGLYESVLHVPLIIRHPGLPGLAGRRFSHLVERIDLTPTVLDMAGASSWGMGLQGRSLLPLMREPLIPWKTHAFASSKRSVFFATDLLLDERVVRDRRWKLHWYLRKGRYELYDLLEDPGEERDLGGLRPDIVKALSFELLRHVERSRPAAPGPPAGGDVPEPPGLEPPAH